MASYVDLPFFLAAVGFISLSGVLMPGPVLAAAIVKGAERKHAGAWIALGHLVVELPLITAIAGGLYYVFRNDWVKIGIGVIGGMLLLYMGARMFQMRTDDEIVKKAFPAHPMVAGILTTATNPYFILWWATVGANLILWGLTFGIVGIITMAIVHESCDLGWDYFVSYSVFVSRKLWTKKVRAYVFGVCGLLLVVFGAYFILAFWLA